MKTLYPKQEIASLKRKKTVLICLAAILFAGVHFVCALLCGNIRPTEITKRYLTVSGISAVSGWISIFLIRHRIRPVSRTLVHVRNMAEAEKTEVTGILVSVGAKQIPPKSLPVCAVSLKNGTDRERYLVRASRADLLKDAVGKNVILTVSNGYVASFGVEADE